MSVNSTIINRHTKQPKMKEKNSKNTRFSLLLLILLLSSVNYAQEVFKITGQLLDIKNAQPLIGATIYIRELDKATNTDVDGKYTFQYVPKGNYTIHFEYIGYKSQYNSITVTSDIQQKNYLEGQTELLNELVIVQNSKKLDIKKPEMSVNKLSVQEIKKMPAVMGEVDVLKSILQLPGVTNAGEGASGFNVRGGSAGQNLVLLDDISIFSSSHLFGFFSVFNADVIKDIKLYKGGIPSRYGSRASSVLEVNQRNGDKTAFKATGGIGVISSRLSLEGPIVKDKLSFLLAGRASYAHLFLKLTDNDNAAYFYDLNTKISYTIDNKNELGLSGYFGRDVFNFKDALNNQFGNTAFNLNWDREFNDNINAKATISYTNYFYELMLDFVKFNWKSDIKSVNLKYDISHYINERFALKYGVSSIQHTFNPGELEPIGDDSFINYKKLQGKKALENGIYIEAEQQLLPKLTFNYGIRYSSFYRYGPEKIQTYQNNQTVDYNRELGIYTPGTSIGETNYKKGKSITTFHDWEPRISASYAIDSEQSIKASFTQMTQYLHLISNTAAPTPLDIWTPSGPYLQPEKVNQWAVGYFKNFKQGAYTLEAESYYKKGKNTVDYIDGADLIANDALETVLLTGESRSYGIELLLRKNTGKFNGWIAYTLSKSEQRTPGRNEFESGINNGSWYRTPYDKTHDLSIVANYELNEKWSFGAGFALQSGRPVSYPEGQFEYLEDRIPFFGDRNQYSLPFFHHLDISATYIPKKIKEKKWQGEWVFSIYNIYNRKNAASISFKESDVIGQNEAVKLSIFGIIPSVSYNFKF